jgi:hypothetical protein
MTVSGSVAFDTGRAAATAPLSAIAWPTMLTSVV